MTAQLDRFRSFLGPDVAPVKKENIPINPHDKFRALKILKNEPLRNLDHKTKNIVRLIIELYGSLIPDCFECIKTTIGHKEKVLIRFSYNEERLTESRLAPDQKKLGDSKVKLCIIAETASNVAIWYINENSIQTLSKL